MKYLRLFILITITNVIKSSQMTWWAREPNNNKTGFLNLWKIKAQIAYATDLFALPETTLSCVTYTSDTDSAPGENDGCESCSTSSLSTARGCMLHSSCGTKITYCSQVNDGNKPLVTSCYVGQFTAYSLPPITNCPANTFTEYCVVRKTSKMLACLSFFW